jgi:dolichol kinase
MLLVSNRGDTMGGDAAPAQRRQRRTSPAVSAVGGSATVRKRLAETQALHWNRRLFHFLNGYLLVLAFRSFSSKRVFLTTLAVLWTAQLFLEIMRLLNPRLNALVMVLMGPFMRSQEQHRFSGMVPYILGALITIALYPKGVAIIAIVVLSVSDPVAALVGNMVRRYIPELDHSTRARHNKSLVGSVAGFAAATLAMFVVFRASSLRPGNTLCLWLNCLVPSAAAMLAEWLTPSPQRTLPLRWFPFALDDNLLIPLVVALVLQFTVPCLGGVDFDISPWIFL